LTIDFFGYQYLSRVRSLEIPGSLVPVQSTPAERGLFFAMDNTRPGIVETLQAFYPEGKMDTAKDPTGQVFAYFFEVPPEVWAKSKGLQLDSPVPGAVSQPRFPNALPDGPNQGTYHGSLFVSQTGNYRFENRGPGRATVRVDGLPVSGTVPLTKGFCPVQIGWDAPGPKMVPNLFLVGESGKVLKLDETSLTSLRLPRGLLAKYFEGKDWKGKITLQQREPIVNYTNGNDFPVRWGTVLWEGSLDVRRGGTTKFFIITDGQSRLVLDGTPVISTGKANGEVYLEAGKHDLRLYYQLTCGYSQMSLLWVNPETQIKEIIPAGYFD